MHVHGLDLQCSCVVTKGQDTRGASSHTWCRGHALLSVGVREGEGKTRRRSSHTCCCVPGAVSALLLVRLCTTALYYGSVLRTALYYCREYVRGVPAAGARLSWATAEPKATGVRGVEQAAYEVEVTTRDNTSSMAGSSPITISKWRYTPPCSCPSPCVTSPNQNTSRIQQRSLNPTYCMVALFRMRLAGAAGV